MRVYACLRVFACLVCVSGVGVGEGGGGRGVCVCACVRATNTALYIGQVCEPTM